MTLREQYENTRHVLSEVRQYHRDLAALYQRLAVRSSDQRAGMLLNYLASREQKQAAALDLFELTAPDRILDAWFQIACPENLEDFAALTSIDVDMNVEQIRTLVTSADEFLISLLEHVLRCASTADVKEVFQALIDLERAEEKALTKAIHSLREM